MVKSEFQNAILVEYGSPQFALTFSRASCDLIYVAHGSLEGIAVGSQKLPWDNLARMASYAPSERQYFVSCYSQEVVQIASTLRPESQILGFDGVVDAELASLCVIALMHISRGNTEQALDSIFRFFELTVAKTLAPEQHRFLPLSVISLGYLQAPWWASGYGFAWGAVDGRATLGGAYYSGNWYSGSYVMAMSGPYVLTIPGNGAPATHQSALPYAIVSWWCWATGQWYSDPYVYYMTVLLNTNQRFMLAVPAFASAMIYFVIFALSLTSLLGLFVSLVISLFNLFLGFIAPYIPFVSAFLNNPAYSILTLLLNFIDPGSFFYSLLAWDICRPR